MLASLTLAPAIIAVASRFGLFDPKRATTKRRWRRIGTVVVRWPGPVLAATLLIALIGLLALPKYQTNYNERYYIPSAAPSNIGYLASDRHFPQARMEPEVLMVEADHDLRNPTDMLILDRIAKPSSIRRGSRGCKALPDRWGSDRPLVDPVSARHAKHDDHRKPAEPQGPRG